MLYIGSRNQTNKKRFTDDDDGFLDDLGDVGSEFAKGISAGTDQLQGLIGGGGRALIGSILDDDEMFSNGMAYYNEQMAEAAENAAEIGSIEDIEGFGDFVNYSAFVVGNVIPSLVGGGGAGAVGGLVAKRAAMSIAGKNLAKQAAGQISKKQAANMYAVSTVGREALAKRGLKGQMSGAFAFSTAAGAGESFTRIFDETGEEAALTAIVTGVASGGLDAITPMRALKRILPQEQFRDAAEEVAGAIYKKKGIFSRALKEAGKSGVAEGVTETMQEIVQNGALEVVRGMGEELEDSFIERMLSDAKISQYKNAAVAGLVGGTGIGAFTGAVGQDPDNIEPIERQLQLPSPDKDSEPETSINPEDEAIAQAEQRRKEVIEDAQGLPQKRREIPREDPSAARAAAQQDVADRSLPSRREQKTEEQATASRESIQAQIKAQVAGLPAQRDNAKKIIQELLDGTYRNEGVGETVTIPAAENATPEADAPTETSGTLPDPADVSSPLSELVGRDVEYSGNKGLLSRREDGFYVVTQDNGDVFIESGENKTANELGVVPITQGLEFENDFQIDPETKKFTLRGKEYTLARIIKDQDGNPLSLAVRDDKGKKKTIKEKAVLNRVQAQMTPAPDLSQVKVEMDDLPASIQRKLIEQSDQEVIPDQVSAQEAIDIAQSMPNAESLIEAVEEAASFRAVPLAEDTYTPQTFTQTIRRPENTVLSEAIAEINKGQPSQRTDIDEAKIDSLLTGEKVPYKDGNSFVSVEDAEETTPNAKAEIKSALVDLFDAGMPKAFLSDVNGIYVHGNILDDEMNGVYERTKGFVSIYSSLIKASSKDQSGQTNRPATLRFVLAHELGHAFDVTNNHTANSPEFSVEVNGAATTHIDFELGSIMAELANNFNNKTELGLEFAYPFGTAFDMFNAKPEKGTAIIQQEAFAQSFAVFHSSPEILEQYAPVTYNYMKNLLQSEQIDNGQRQNTSPQDDTETSGVRPDVRPQTELRDVQVQDGGGDRRDGGRSPVEEEASQELGQPPIQSDGDSAGRPVQLGRTEVVLKATDKKPTFKKAENYEETGEYIVTFADGDRYTLYFDDDAKDAGDEVYFTSEDGKITGVLGETKEETINELQEHRQKLIDAGENSYNTPINPEVSSDTLSKGYNLVTDHPEGQLKLADLRKKFRKLEDNQFDNLVERLTDPELYSEDLMVVQDGVISHPETVQQIEEERLAEERMIAEEADFENDLNLLADDDMLFAPFSRVPEPDESSPVLPMGKVEQSLSDLLAENPNPTSEQLGSIVGAPKKRKGKESVEDVDVRPVTLDELRGYVEDSLSKSDNLKWYDDFGNMFRDLVGDANLDEASVIFGITSAQNAAENNLAETLHIMSLARKFDPVKQRKQFELAVKATTRPDGQKLKITGKQITAIGDLYANGDFEGGIKTTTYMQMVADRGRNEYNPFSVQDVHMSRVFGFRKKDFDKKSGALVDAAKVSGENEYRYAQYLTSVLAEEFGMTPNQMQATLWFYAKDKLTPKNKGDEDKAKKKLEKLKKKAEAEGVEFDENAPRYGDGTPESSALYAAPEIQVIKDMIADGSFDTASSIADSLSDGVRPRNKPAQKTTPFSTVNEREGLMDLARARSPKLIASAVAGKGRGLAFPDDTPIETLVQYNQDVMAAIVDDGGQIPILRELGIPHEIEESAGTFTGYEPSIMIRLLGGNLETANKLAPLLGDALLQDSVITSQAVYAEAGLPAFVVVKKDGSDFSRADAMALAEAMNPSKDPEGINFNQPMNDTLMFLDSRSMKDGFEYTELHAKEFYSNLINQLGGDYSVGTITTQGDYHGSDQYREAIEGAWNRETPSGSQNIYDRTNASLYEPVRKVYNEYAEKLGIPKREAQSLDLLSSPPSSDRLQRARDMGFNTDTVYYHGTDQEFTSFAKSKRGSTTGDSDAKLGFFFSSDPAVASSYTSDSINNIDFDKGLNGALNKLTGGLFEDFSRSVNNVARNLGADISPEINSPQVLPVYTKSNNQFTVDAKGAEYSEAQFSTYLKSAIKSGYDSVLIKNVRDEGFTGGNDDASQASDILVVFSPENIRSVNADFNPEMADSSDLLSSPPSKPVGKPNTNVIPEVNAAYQKFKAGEISQQDFDTVVLSTISEYDFVPTPATYDEMFGALNKNKKQKINIEIQDGEVVGLRLDIPAYTDHGVWVPTIHGDKTSHRATASITGVRFGDDKQPAKAQKVMEGGHKSPFAQMRGAFVNRTDAENEALAKEALNDPDWTQIGFDPRRHSYFYDRKTGQPILSASEVIQVGPLVLAKNAKSEGKTSSDFLYSPPSPTSEEANAARNAAIREEKKTVDKATGWVKKTFKRQLTSRGLLNEQVFQAKIARDGEFGAAEIDTRMYLNSYDKAVKDANLSEEQTALLSEAIATPLDQLNKMDLPDAVKQAIGGMRKYIDKMSIDYAQVVADQALALVENGKGEAAAAKIDLLNTIASKRGKYLNRSYQVFDDPKWANKVPKSVIDNARTFLESNGAKNADRIINTILKTGTAFDGLSNFISEGKLGSKDLSILKKRKDIAPEILALMGEYTDPRINFVKTATKVSRLLWNHRFLEQVKLEGQRDGFLFTAEDAPTDAYVQIAPDSSDAMNPLNGLYTTPELAQGFEDSMDLGSNVAWVQKWQQVNSVVKYGKTVIAPTTVARNFMSASLFTIANGHFNWAKAGASLRSLDGYFSSKEGDATAYLREIRRLGVVYDSPYAGELTKALEDFSQGTELDNKVRAVDGLKDKAVQKSKGFLDLMAKNYQYGDDFWKIIGFENMVDVLMDNKGLTREQAMPLAAERIRDTYPTYSLIGKGVKDLRRFPLVGTFVSFPAEIVRTSFNMFKYLKQDMADPDMKGHAMAKVAGMSAVSFGIYALQDAAMRAFDVDEEEQEAIRLMSPTWSENSNILPTGRDDDGNLEYIDLTYLDPYAYFKKPINALMRDQPTEDAIVQAGRELLTPFLGVDIATGTALELYNNEKVSGGRIWNPADTPTNKLSAATEHLMKGAGPAVIQNVTRTGKAINGDVSKSGKRYELEDELKAWVGFRVTTFDPKISLHFKAYEFNEDKRNASSLLTSTFRDPNQLDEGELVNAFERASAARKEGYERMIKLVSAARKSGLNNTQLMMVLRSNGVTKKDARALIAGNPATWEMSDSTLKNSVKKSDLLFGESTGKEFQDRWKIIQQMLREEAR